MPNYLLTGAGFSRNWGGWLASEVFEYLLGCRLDPPLRGLLWDFKEKGLGFEDVLGHLQEQHEQHWSAQNEEHLRNLTGVLQRMFIEMNSGFASKQFEPQDGAGFYPRESIISFLGRFDTLFTLNQDLLIEQKYQSNQGRAFYRPGFASSADKMDAGPGRRPFSLYNPSETLVLKHGHQPYIKLHGSSDLVDNDRDMMIIMGANKLGLLQRHALLKWYLGIFSDQLMMPQSKLVIIGYSFSDVHINQIITSAAGAGLRLFIFDPLGVDILDKRKSDQPGVYNVYQDLRGAVDGASRRPLPSIFGKNDPIELNKIYRFLQAQADSSP